jgi:CRP-like cAMP-binding protein
MSTEIIKKTFNGISEKCLNNIIEESERLSVKGPNTLWKQNDKANFVVILESGLIKLTYKEKGKTEEIRRLIFEGNNAGMESAVQSSNYRYTATCITDCTVIKIPSSVILKAFKQDKQFLFKWLNLLCEEIEQTELIILNNLKFSVEQRLASLLTGNFFKGKNVIPNQLVSIKDLAGLIGTSPAYLYNTLQKLKKKEIITLQEKNIVIINSIALKKMATIEEN